MFLELLSEKFARRNKFILQLLDDCCTVCAQERAIAHQQNWPTPSSLQVKRRTVLSNLDIKVADQSGSRKVVVCDTFVGDPRAAQPTTPTKAVIVVFVLPILVLLLRSTALSRALVGVARKSKRWLTDKRDARPALRTHPLALPLHTH